MKNNLVDVEIKKDKVIASNDLGYLLLNWIAIAVVLLIPSCVAVYSLNGIPTYLKWTLFILAIAIGLYIPSYFFLYTLEIRSSGVRMNYQLQHLAHKNIKLPFKAIRKVKFTYYGGKGSGGTGTLKIYYSTAGQSKSLKCYMDPLQASRCRAAMIENGVPVEIKPTWVLNEFYNK
jgi:hypothetical protein